MAPTSTQLNQSHHHTEDDPEVIRARIEKTRAHMSGTINEIQARLSPDHLKQQAKDSIKEATIGKAEKMAHIATGKAQRWGTNVTETVKHNPIPAALVGIGLSWLLVETVKDNSHKNDDYYYYPAGDSQSALKLSPPTEEGIVDKTKSTITYGIHQAQEKAKEAGSTIAEKAGEMASAVQSKVGHVAENVQDTVQEQAGAWRDTTRYQAQIQSRRARQNLQNGYFNNPLAFGAAAVVAGAAIGLMLPATQKEDELMGETRDRLVGQAQHTAKETMRKAEQVAREAAESAKESAKAEARRQDMPAVS